MKTNEFIKKVKELGYCIEYNDYVLNIYTKDVYGLPYLLGLYINKQYSLRVFPENFSSYIDQEKREELYNLAVEYDRTPIEEREEKKKYQLLPNLDVFHLSGYSLGMNRKSKKVMFPCPYVENEFYQKKFTDTDIKKMPTWVNDFIEQGYLIKGEIKDDNEN